MASAHSTGIVYPYIRNTETKTLAEFADDIVEPTKTHTIDPTKIKCGNETVTFPLTKGKKCEVPLDSDAVVSLSDTLGVPPKFIQRQPADFRAQILNGLAKRLPGGEVNLVVSDKGDRLIEIYESTGKRFVPEMVVESALQVMPHDSIVTEWWNTPRMFQADIVLPATARKGVTTKAKVGDVTRGGLRVGIDRQHHLAPWVSSYLYRLICTNGLERVDHGTKVDGRVGPIDEVMAEYLKQMHIVFARLDDHVKQFYALREDKIPHDQIDTILRRTVNEHGLSFGSDLDAMMDMALSSSDSSMFDVVNIITNAANDPSIVNKPANRRKIEKAGGDIVHESHITRCPQCLTRMAG
jgi:hypothetical protein